MNKLFCAYPWINLFISNSGRQQPCCFASSDATASGGAPNIFAVQDVTELWNSSYLTKIRQEMLQQKFPKACNSCRQNETCGVKSPRQTSLESYGHLLSPEYLSYDDMGVVSSPVRMLDLRLGNTCNLKCRMCHPSSSNQLIKEYLSSNDPEMMRDAKIAKDRPSWSSLEQTISLFKSQIIQPEHIHFAGGEPSIEPLHKKLLAWLTDNGYAKKLTVSYNTNLVQIDPIVHHLSDFKRVSFIVSLDGIGKVNDYIRYPSHWQTIADNLQSLMELRMTSPNLEILVNSTVQAYNILHLGELYEYFAELSFKYQSIVPKATMLLDPQYLSAMVLPKDLREQAAQRLRQTQGTIKFSDSHATILAQERIEHVLIFMQQSEPADFHFTEFMKKTEYFDGQRRQSVGELVPSLAQSD